MYGPTEAQIGRPLEESTIDIDLEIEKVSSDESNDLDASNVRIIIHNWPERV